MKKTLLLATLLLAAFAASAQDTASARKAEKVCKNDSAYYWQFL